MIRHLRWTGVLLISSFFLASAQEARAEVNPAILGMEQVYTSRIQPAIQVIDPYGFASVRITVKQVSQALAGTPFSVKNLSVKSADGSFELSGMEISIYLEDDRDSQSVSEVVQGLVGDFSFKPVIRVRKLPREFVRSARSKKLRDQEELLSAQAKMTAASKPDAPKAEDLDVGRKPSSFDPSLGEASQTASKELGTMRRLIGDYIQASRQSDEERSSLLIKLAGAVGLLWLMGLVARWLGSRQGSKMMQRLESALTSGLGQAFGGIAGGAKASDPIPSSSERSGATGGKGVLAEYPAEIVCRLMVDAYWTARDAYASSIWRSANLEQKAQVLEQLPWLRAYAGYAIEMAPVDLGYENDPAYLSSMSWMHLDQPALAKLLRSHPGLYAWLPRIRREALGLKLDEQLAYERAPALLMEAAIDLLQAVPPSPARLIPASGSAIAIRDVAEEEGLLDSPEPLDRLVLGRLSSLIGARTLSDADLMSILEKFDARDLASAWIAPPAILERMKAQLTPAKAELLDSYLETTKPSREGVAFGRLRLAILQGLDEARKDGDAAA